MIVLVVDGYNMIGDWPELRELKDYKLEEARAKLVEMLAEYQAYTGYRVIVVFDAYGVKGTEKKQKEHRLDVIFTKENETADERIEKLVNEVMNVRTKVYVATSDYTEQWTIFSKGALRKSARELLIDVREIQSEIKNDVKEHQSLQPKSKIPLSDDVLKAFEKWRRGGK
ncbi:NYN domain-containing protein [Filobacillus milosensis]|uniref:NYN domain-containing protein n=1 Tax=Filobacillus milosensis TaxID=94137 RepID=A0A4Y8IES3_9BACI|nr:NYN domain-containing protein [Filobacillus milosensis]TFB14746.1 NYN domain-containing protein [Filobacillus milosensis]